MSNPAPSRFAILLPALLAACAAPAPNPYAAPPPSPTYVNAVRGDFASTMLAEHNRARADYGSAPLRWDESLAADAERYARTMASNDVFRHDPDPSRRRQQGENIWRGTRGAYGYSQMLDAMIDERRFFRAGIFPDVSRTGDWSDVGHYTQIIWPTTTHVGCGVASSARYDYMVCRYAPPGNIDGRQMDAPETIRPIR